MPSKDAPINIISLGAGVQSSTVALMAHLGQILPKPEYAVFADTHAEPANVYKHLEFLESVLSFPVVRVSAGSLTEAALKPETSKKSGITTIDRLLPVYYFAHNQRNMAKRRCTEDFKIRPIRRFAHQFISRRVISWIGISTDEATRMRDSRVRYITNRYPLIELGMNRQDCLDWNRENGFPEPPKSSCVFCPFRGDRQWLSMYKNDRASFDAAVSFEKDLHAAQHRHETFPFVGYIHKSMKPLDDALFVKTRQPDMFENDCSGSCGV